MNNSIHPDRRKELIQQNQLQLTKLQFKAMRR